MTLYVSPGYDRFARRWGFRVANEYGTVQATDWTKAGAVDKARELGAETVVAYAVNGRRSVAEF